MNKDKLFSISEIARETKVTPRTIRFYETKGLISPRRAGNTRVYSYRDKARMTLILRGKRLGFSLSGIKEYLDLYDHDSNHIKQIQHLLVRVRSRIWNLENQGRDLKEALKELRDIERQAVLAIDAADGNERKTPS